MGIQESALFQADAEPASGIPHPTNTGVFITDGAINTMARMLTEGQISQDTIDTYGQTVQNAVRFEVLGLGKS